MASFSGLVVDNILDEKVIAECSDTILRQTFDSRKIAKSIAYLSAENEKKAHLDVINKVFSEKN
ncbi:MAG: hypothetical protein GQ532_11905 [Methylomarinum sp.]|nr:hypothetical protein [Methylomarinum sp.]